MQDIPSTAFTTACNCSAVMEQVWKSGFKVLGPHWLLDSLLDGKRKQREAICLLRGTRLLSVHTIVQWEVNDKGFLIPIMNMKISKIKEKKKNQ